MRVTSHPTIGATSIELPMSIISRAARASATRMSHTSTARMSPRDTRAGARLEQPPRGAARPDVVELWVAEHAVGGDEHPDHVRTLADVTRGVESDAVVEALLLGLLLHRHGGTVCA